MMSLKIGLKVEMSFVLTFTSLKEAKVGSLGKTPSNFHSHIITTTPHMYTFTSGWREACG